MKNFVNQFLTILMIGGIFFIVGCEKENKSNLTNNHIQVRNSTLGGLLDFNNIEPKHQDMAKLLSLYLKEPLVWNDFKSKTNFADSSILLGDYFYNNIISSNTLRTAMESKVNSLNNFFDNGDLLQINNYLATFPGIEISIIDDSDNNMIVKGNEIPEFEVVCVYSNSNTYPRFKNGSFVGNYDESESPTNKIIVKLKINDQFFTYDNGAINELVILNDLLNYQSVLNFLAAQPQKNASTKLVGSRIFNNPIGGLKVVQIKDIVDFYNANVVWSPPTYSPPPPPDSPPTNDPCSNGARNLVQNDKERIIELRGNGTKTWLRDCGTWCSYFDKNCLIQVDLYIPVISDQNSSEYKVIGTQNKVMTINEKRLRKGWYNNPDLAMTEWLFLEGKHGDEWQYSFMGRHRKRGETEEKTFTVSLSGKITFKLFGQGVDLNPSASSTTKKIKSNKDCELGNDISRYCVSTLPEPLTTGNFTFKVNEGRLP